MESTARPKPLVISLLQTMVRLDGEALMLHSNRTPQVVGPKGVIELGSRPLPADVVAELAKGVLPAESRVLLQTFGTAAHTLAPMPDFAGQRFTIAVSARGGDWSLVIQRTPLNETVEVTTPTIAAKPPRFPALVLLIDDSLDQLDLYEMALTDKFAVMTTHTGDAGVVLAIAEQPDAIIVDLNMPKVNGWDVCRQLKAHEETAGIPVIVLTAADVPQMEEQAMRVGAWQLLRKPCTVDRLRDQVQLAVRH